MQPDFGRISNRSACGGAILALLAGCLSHRPAELVVLPVSHLAPNDPFPCQADRMQALVGQHFSVLAGQNLGGDLRILYPDQGVTPEVMPTRLDVQVDRDGMIHKLFCG